MLCVGTARSWWRRSFVRRWCSLDGAVLRRQFRTLEGGGSGITNVTQKDIRHVLDTNRYSYAVGHASFMLQCPFCERAARSSQKTMFLNKTTGSVVCRPCGVRGTWSDFCSWVKTFKSQKCRSQLPVVASPAPSTGQEAQQFWASTQPWSDSATSITDQAIQAFGIQKLLPTYLKKYGVHTVTAKFPTPSGHVADLPCVAFPWFDSRQDGHPIRVKLETLAPPMHRQTALQPREGALGLFGWNTVAQGAKEVVITAGEFDAIAVHQSTRLPAVALPTGIVSLPPEVLPQLEQFKRIYLWLGSDVQSRQAASHFAKKLNVERCYLICGNEEQRLMPSPLEALNKGMDLKAVVTAAKPFTHKQIVTFQQLRGEVLGELTNASLVAGVKWQRFPRLTSILKGHRPGELTVLTGPTGSGKTTLISELSLDLCQQGVSTLWGSFEIRNVRLAKTMLKQFSGLSLERHLKQYNFWADKLQQLPLYFMGFYGPVDLHTVIETMSHAAYVYDIQHVIVDNLQFMMGSTHQLYDRFSQQSQAIAEFRKFASLKNVHVTVVMHPRKEDENMELTTSSIFGTAKATQEADNVVILQSPRGSKKYLQVTKNRFDGDLGKLTLDFDRDSLTLSGYYKNRSSADAASDHTPPSLRGLSTGRSSKDFNDTTTDSKSATQKPRSSSFNKAAKPLSKYSVRLRSSSTLKTSSSGNGSKPLSQASTAVGKSTAAMNLRNKKAAQSLKKRSDMQSSKRVNTHEEEGKDSVATAKESLHIEQESVHLESIEGPDSSASDSVTGESQLCSSM